MGCYQLFSVEDVFSFAVPSFDLAGIVAVDIVVRHSLDAANVFAELQGTTLLVSTMEIVCEEEEMAESATILVFETENVVDGDASFDHCHRHRHRHHPRNWTGWSSAAACDIDCYCYCYCCCCYYACGCLRQFFVAPRIVDWTVFDHGAPMSDDLDGNGGREKIDVPVARPEMP